MATRSNIGVLQDDGTIKAIYCHWDGDPEHVGATLANHYDSHEKASELIALGDISSLSTTLELTAEAVYKGEDKQGTQARTFKNADEWREYASEQWAEYLYLYQPTPYGSRGYEWAYMEVNKYWKPIAKSLLKTGEYNA